ncbi:hypothetical protein RhiirC2_789209 [Rhizophagus irregularis]|uniref:Uncharacterized protein n=1 Tax=Rhizophagus irregularis TaxID=588596 RepID=A0A2N1MNM5_9GLOM|nr:hypothetical protein RhiirC2_789209 [Rhizophagus irregularis]
MENLRKRQCVSVVQPLTHLKKYKKLTSDPAFKSRRIFTENLVAVHCCKTEVNLNRPIYIGMCVLDLSKLCMYQFYYDTLKAKYKDKVRLCYTDTDSLLVQIQTENINADLINMADQFDFSNYPIDHPIRQAIGDEKIAENTKVPGLFNECNGAIIVEFISLHPKMYSILKGANHMDKVTFLAIRSDKHSIHTVEMSKVGLSPMDDKKWIAPDNITTYAHDDLLRQGFQKPPDPVHIKLPSMPDLVMTPIDQTVIPENSQKKDKQKAHVTADKQITNQSTKANPDKAQNKPKAKNTPNMKKSGKSDMNLDRNKPKKKDKPASLKKVSKNNNQEEKYPNTQKKVKKSLKKKGNNKDNKAVLAEILTLLQKLV